LLSTKDNKVLHNSAKKVNRAIWSWGDFERGKVIIGVALG
jgi:hypothetical protein